MEHNGAYRVRVLIRKVLPLMMIAVIAFSLKWYYSRATTGQLRWILSPTAATVGLLNDRTFTYEAGDGYCDYTHRTVIAPVCAGVNFMIVVFCMVAVMGILQTKRWKEYLLVTVTALAVAGTATILVNVVRITLGIYCFDNNLHHGWLTPERVHRLGGITVYFIALCGLYAGVDRVLRLFTSYFSPDGKRIADSGTKGLSGILVPAFWYLAMTVAVPLLLGKYSLYGVHLFEHALFVFLVPGVVLAIALLLRRSHLTSSGAL